MNFSEFAQNEMKKSLISSRLLLQLSGGRGWCGFLLLFDLCKCRPDCGLRLTLGPVLVGDSNCPSEAGLCHSCNQFG